MGGHCFLELYVASCLRTLCLFESPELIENVKLIHKPVSLQPRGLINKGNWCYINAVSFHTAFCCSYTLPSALCLTLGNATRSCVGPWHVGIYFNNIVPLCNVVLCLWLSLAEE